MSKETTRYIITTLATFALVITVTVSQAWTSPTAAPTGGNVSAPLTTGNGSQTKSSGDISLGGGGSIYAGGVVAAPTLCIGGDCRGAWPAAAADNFGNHTATMNVNMAGMQVTNLGGTTNPNDAATKAYVDAKFGSNNADCTPSTIATYKAVYGLSYVSSYSFPGRHGQVKVVTLMTGSPTSPVPASSAFQCWNDTIVLIASF